MSIPYLGDFAEDATVYHYFNTFDSNDPANSVTITNLADTDLYVHKDGSVTQIATDGATVAIDFDSRTGIHKIEIDTSVSADYSTGSDYVVLMEGTTVDGGTVTAALFTFSIENRSSERIYSDTTVVEAWGLSSVASDTAAIESELIQVHSETTVIQTDTTNIYSDTTHIHSETTDIQGRVPAALVGGRIDADVGAMQANVITNTAIATDAIGSDELATTAVAEIADGVWDEDIADHVTLGTMGQAVELAAYAGPLGPGVYLDDGAANTTNVAGEDGIPSNPVSTVAAAKLVAGQIGVNRYYLVGNAAALSLDSTHEDWEFVGLTSQGSNLLNLNSQDVDRSVFRNLTLEGTQAGTERITAYDCIVQDESGAGTTTLHIHAIRCGLPSTGSGIILTNNDDHIFESCYSMVAGGGAPVIDANSGANADINIRHYSGGVEFENLASTSVVSVETDGQVIFAATCNTSATVALRGNMTITDNTGGMSALTTDAVYDKRAQIATIASDVALFEAAQTEPTGVPAANESPLDKIGYLFMVMRNKRDVTSSKLTIYGDDDVGEWEHDLTDAAGTTTVSEANAI